MTMSSRRSARPIRKLFSKEQRAFFATHAREGVGPDDLTFLGPINVLKLKYWMSGFDWWIVAELWLYPDGSRILELSTKCPPAEAFQVAAEARASWQPRHRPRGRAADQDPDCGFQFFWELAATS